VLECWGAEIPYFKGTPSWISQKKKKILMPLEPKLLVMGKKICEELQIVCEALYTV
jgi:hypothetical protein